MTRHNYARAFTCGANLAAFEKALAMIRQTDRSIMSEDLQQRISTADSLLLGIIQQLWVEDVKIRKSLDSE